MNEELEFPKFMRFEGEKAIDIRTFMSTGEIIFVEDDDPRATMIISNTDEE